MRLITRSRLWSLWTSALASAAVVVVGLVVEVIR